MTPPRATMVWALCLVVPALYCASADDAVTVGGRPDWVEPVPLEATDGVPPDAAAGGIWHVLLDEQYHAERAEYYGHFAKKLTSDAGVQEGSQLSITFDPTFQSLRLNRLVIHRNGEHIDRLLTQPFRVLAYETAADTHLYDGRQYVLMVLEDIRIGDVIEYAYTRFGVNPVFNGHFMANISINWSVPLRQFHGRVVHATSRNVHYRMVNWDTAPLRIERKGLVEWVFNARDLAAVHIDDDTPDWYDPYAWVEFSDFTDWADVADWAVSVHRLPETLPEAVAAEVTKLQQWPTEAERIQAALEFVQKQIRYIGIEMGENSHRPYPLDVVMQRRFGDCKDKARLLCALLRAMGVEAVPVLVDTSLRHTVATSLPSPLCFDHVIVRIRYQENPIWVDPTASFQRGPFQQRYLPDYGFSLPVTEGVVKLDPVISPQWPEAMMETIETFTINDYEGTAELEVKTTWRSWEADSIRSTLAETPVEEMNRRYLNYYADSYPQIEAISPPRFNDDEEHNVVSSREHYRISGFWETRDDRRKHAEFYAQSMRDYLDEPRTRLRSDPLALSHPVHMRQTLRVNFPDDDWDFEAADTRIDGPGFRFSSRQTFRDRQLEMAYEYESLREYVDAEDVDVYLAKVEEVKTNLGYEIWFGGNVSQLPALAELADQLRDVNWMFVLVGIVGVLVVLLGGMLILVVFLVRASAHRHPPPLPR